MLAETPNLIHDEKASQFRLELEEGIAKVDYKIRNGLMYLIHSEVPYQFRGKGVGKVLVEKVFEYVEQHDIKAVAVCSYIKLVAQRSEKWSKIIN